MRESTRAKLAGLGRILQIAALASMACAGLQLGAAASASAGTLDQQQTTVNAEPALFGTQSLAQTFTPAITGALDQVDLSLAKVGNPPAPSVIVEIRSTSAGVPGPLSGVLGSGSVAVADLAAAQAFKTVAIAPPVPVCAGTQYAIVAYNAGIVMNAVTWGQDVNGNLYPAGQTWVSPDAPPNSTWNSGGDSDQAFKTYVEPSGPCPPPPTVPSTPPSAPATPAASTGLQAAALKKCKKKKSKKARKKCKKKAMKLPV